MEYWQDMKTRQQQNQNKLNKSFKRIWSGPSKQEKMRILYELRKQLMKKSRESLKYALESTWSKVKWERAKDITKKKKRYMKNKSNKKLIASVLIFFFVYCYHL